MYPLVDSGPSAHMLFHILSIQSHQASALRCSPHQEGAVAVEEAEGLEEEVPLEAASEAVAVEAGNLNLDMFNSLFLSFG